MLLVCCQQASAHKKREASAAAALSEAEREGCTFWPQLTGPPRALYGKRPTNDEQHAPSSLFHGETEAEEAEESGMDGGSSGSIHSRIRPSRAELLSEKSSQQRREEAELAECCFYPTTNLLPAFYQQEGLQQPWPITEEGTTAIRGEGGVQDEGDLMAKELEGGAEEDATLPLPSSLAAVKSASSHVQRLRSGPSGFEALQLKELQEREVPLPPVYTLSTIYKCAERLCVCSGVPRPEWQPWSHTARALKSPRPNQSALPCSLAPQQPSAALGRS